MNPVRPQKRSNRMNKGRPNRVKIKPEEISSIIKKQIDSYKVKVKTEKIGIVTEVGDGIASIYGMDEAMAGELVLFPHGIYGMVLNLDEHTVGAVIFGDDKFIKEADEVKLTGSVAEVEVGDELIGRVLNGLGRPIDGKGPISAKKKRLIERMAPGVVERQPVKEPLQTGIKAIDSMIPIGRGQRELIIGDRQTGKTAIAVDTVINQRGQDVICIYVAIGQKNSTVAKVIEILSKHKAMDYSIVISATASDPTPLQYLAPYVGCAIGEEFRDKGKHALIIYDDLSKHARCYREISLLLRRPPGREAYPGDIFYAHSRLLERACKLSDEFGGGSLTALPLIETQAGDVTTYIPTNVISITDGQIYLETGLFHQGVRPAVNVGLSVSRVGGNAQIKAMKSIAGMLRLELAQYREMETFAQFGTELDKTTLAQIEKGKRLVEVLKQEQYKVMPVSEEIAVIYCGVRDHLNTIDVEDIKRFEEEFLNFMRNEKKEILNKIENKKEITPEIEKDLEEAIAQFKSRFIKGKA